MFSQLGGMMSFLLLPLLALAPAVNSGSSASPELPPTQYQNTASLFSPWDGCTTYTPSALTSPGFTGGMAQCDGSTSEGLDGVTDFESVPASVSLPLTLGAGQWEQLEVESVSATPLTPAQWKKLAPAGAVAPTTSGRVTALKPEVTATLSDSTAVVKKDMSVDERVNVKFSAPSFNEETGSRLNQVGWLARVDLHVTATAESGKEYPLVLSELASVQGDSWWYSLPEWKQTSTDAGVGCNEGELCAGGVVYPLTALSYSTADANDYAAEPGDSGPSTDPTAPATSEPTAPASTEPATPTSPTAPAEPTTKPTAPAPPLVSGPTDPVPVPTTPTAPATPEKPSAPASEPSAPADPAAPVTAPTEPAKPIASKPAAPSESVPKGTGKPELHAQSSEPVAANGSSASDTNAALRSPNGTAAAEPQKEKAAARVEAAGSPDSLKLSPAQQVQLTLLFLILLYIAFISLAAIMRHGAVRRKKLQQLSNPPRLSQEEAAQIYNRGENS